MARRQWPSRLATTGGSCTSVRSKEQGTARAALKRIDGKGQAQEIAKDLIERSVGKKSREIRGFPLEQSPLRRRLEERDAPDLWLPPDSVSGPRDRLVSERKKGEGGDLRLRRALASLGRGEGGGAGWAGCSGVGRGVKKGEGVSTRANKE